MSNALDTIWREGLGELAEYTEADDAPVRVRARLVHRRRRRRAIGVTVTSVWVLAGIFTFSTLTHDGGQAPVEVGPGDTSTSPVTTAPANPTPTTPTTSTAPPPTTPGVDVTKQGAARVAPVARVPAARAPASRVPRDLAGRGEPRGAGPEAVRHRGAAGGHRGHEHVAHHRGSRGADRADDEPEADHRHDSDRGPTRGAGAPRCRARRQRVAIVFPADGRGDLRDLVRRRSDRGVCERGAAVHDPHPVGEDGVHLAARGRNEDHHDAHHRGILTGRARSVKGSGSGAFRCAS